jgi:hypothetical protein
MDGLDEIPFYVVAEDLPSRNTSQWASPAYATKG